MSCIYRYLFYLAFILMSLDSLAQFDPNSVCRVQDGKLIFLLDSRWNAAQKREIAKTFNLDSLLLKKVFSGDTKIFADSIDWEVKKIGPLYQLSRNLNQNIVPKPNKYDILLLNDKFFDYPDIAVAVPVNFGINRFTRANVFKYKNGQASFFLPGNKNCKQVYLSGSFNEWSTMGTPMHLSDSGWTCTVRLPPGKHLYKYIVEGRWITDPNNKNRENDGKGNNNSYVFCYNYSFRLGGYLQSHKVFLAGNFNDWNPHDLAMTRTAQGWELPVYLRQGTYSYKFIVDNEWITDPSNKKIRSDAEGNLNSFLEFGDTITFRLRSYKSARQVILSGSFNGWSTNELVMNKTGSGWELPYVMAPGNYEYKFIVDGKWITDPDNTCSNGSGDYINSCISFKPNFEFRLKKFGSAKHVMVSGTFNNWSNSGYTMKLKDGEWSLPIFLDPGKYLYKYIVDGKWIIDPDNKLWEENEYGTGNSVLWIQAK